MTGPTRGLFTLACLATLTLSLTACDGSVEGNPSPTTSAGQGSSSATPPLSDTPLAGMSSCKTLDQAVAGQGFPASTPTLADPEHACESLKAGYGTVGLDLQDGQSYDTSFSNTDQLVSGNVRKRRAFLEPGINHGTGGCGVSMEVKPKSRALVVLTLSSGSTDQSCIGARKVAEAVDLMLPSNG
ncbi:hypothetical protein [Amycolatopsis sp. NPDC050768]|uniref:hypothetical protein n=1 Tax=Amycolatopsis sp. NPDC050768 TaxID=3154839 RepID=UPI00340EB13B